MNYYVNITPGINNGTGTVNSPFALNQFSDYIENSIVDGDVFYVRGHYEVGETETLLLSKLGGNGSSGSHVGITIRGWDVSTYGPPIIKWTNPVEYEAHGVNAFWQIESAGDYTDVVLQDFILQSINVICPMGEVTNDNVFTLKDVVIVANEIYNHKTGYSTPVHKFFGCTFNSQKLTLHRVSECWIYDSVLDGGTISIGDIGKLVSVNNLTTLQNISKYMYNVGDMTEYSDPIYNSNILSTPTETDFSTFIKVYTDRDAMYFGRYNIPETRQAYLREVRTTNTYDTGLFGDVRLSVGAYSFVGTSASTYPTSGHIGAFYFGGEYSNNEGSANSTITISPATVSATVDAFGSSNAEISLFTTSARGKGNRNFSIDFVAKNRTEPTYPKFCGEYNAIGTVCICDDEPHDRYDALADDCEIYSGAVRGGNPLIVDFSATSKAMAEFNNYNAIAYNWYFDYTNNPTEYVTCAGTYASHTYCGSYLETFDVRLCVDFDTTS